ncbi:aminotransferase-like domain-containing protein [Acinetobacter pullicarnis]|uniref:aminotransferase-like domain-containing protein n=1 Tax=Acinetobacter pullicarnis TaxID=2576829 RepID=UPI0011203335|nr:PLP-dependent aminotransferase family protein [Acinetobacter pullicarnis]
MDSNAILLVDQIYQILKHQIKSQLYKENEKIPSIRKLCDQYNISKNTVISALERLIDEGLIYSKPASGFFVMEQKITPRFKQANIEMQNIDELWLMRRQLETFNGVINVGDGFPDTAWFELLPLNKLLQKSIQENRTKLLRYGSKYGYENLREILCLRLSRLNIKTAADNILLTNGVNDAIDLIIRYFVESNTTVLVDSPIYYPLLKKLQLTHCKILEIPRLADGPDCDVLEYYLKNKSPKLFFTQSISHNPTGTHICAEKINIINTLCKENNCLIIENDIFSEYTEIKNRLSSHSNFSHHLYIGGFSKIISPSIRVGFIVGEHHLIDKLSDFKAILHVNSSEYAEQFICTILQSKFYEQHLTFFKENLKLSSKLALDNIKKLGGQVFYESTDSLYCWASFEHLDFSHEMMNRAIENKLIFAPGYIFSLQGQQYNQWTRLNIGVAASPNFYENFNHFLNNEH